MCTSLGELKEAMGAYMASFDAGLVPPGELSAALGNAGAIEKMAAGAACMLAARMAGGAGTLAGGAFAARQAAEALARSAGTSLGEARRAIGAGRAMAKEPALGAAARRGELSRRQAGLVAEALGADPGAAGRLLQSARPASLSELAEECARAQAAVADLEARRRAAHAARALRSYTDGTGTWHLHAQGLPEDGAKVMAAVGALADKAFEVARKEGRREGPEAYAFDGLVALASSGGAKLNAEVLVRVDHSALLRGYPVEAETCEVAGLGPLSPKAVIDMIDCGDPFIKAVVTKGKDVASVAHLGRRPNAHQQSALDWLFPTCAAEGCGTRGQFCQADHREDWARTHYTVLGLIDRLCRYHHALKTTKGWALVEGRGKRAFVPPEDPRHPRHAGGAEGYLP